MLRRMTIMFALLALALPLMGAGCGPGASNDDTSSDFVGEQRAVATTVEDLQDAGSKDKASEICDHLLSKSLVDQITKASGKSCTDAIDKTLQDVDAYELVVIPKGVTITGTTATARVRSENGDDKNTSELKLVKEAGRWKISAIGNAGPTTS